MTKIELTSGRLTSLARLLVFLGKNPHMDLGSALPYLIQLQQIPTVQVADDIAFLATKLGLVTDSNGLSVLSSSGRAIVLGPSDATGIALQRRLLLKIIQSVRRDLMWLAFAQPNEIRAELPYVHQILSELKLVGRNPTEDAQLFWSDLRLAGKKVDDALLKRIGDQAEAWSMHFEKTRLTHAGFENLAREIVWLSRESDLHGYDILSFSGHAPLVGERRHIEVKRGSVTNSGSVDFYLSRNEFNQAQQLGSKYLYHLWWLKSGAPTLTILDSRVVGELAPKDVNDENIWTECKISIEIREISEAYTLDSELGDESN
jgi:hypothetical protein